MDMEKIKYINKVSAGNNEEDTFEFRVGMEIGLMDPFSMDKETVRWFTIAAIAPIDEDIAVGMLYLRSIHDEKNIHSTVVDGVAFPYAEITDTISDLLVLP